MAKREATSNAKPAGKPRRGAPMETAFTALALSHENRDRLEALERRLFPMLERLETADSAARPDPGPKRPQTTAPSDPNELRREMCHEIRDFFLERWGDTIAVDGLAFVSSVWVEMLAVAIAATVNLELDEFEQLDQRTKLVELAFDQISRRARDYVEQRKKQPTTVQ